MKVSTHFCIIAIFTISTTCISAYPKSSNDNKFSLSKDNEANVYPVKRKAPVPPQPSFVAAHEEEPDFGSTFVSEPNARHRRIDRDYDRKSQSSLENVLDLKRTSLMNRMGKRADRLYKRDLRPSRREEAYGIVYGNGRPIGILEPFPQAYELSPMFNSREGIEEIEPVPQVNPRAAMDMLYTDRVASNLRGDWEENSNNVQESGKFTNEKYPAAMNDYKITNRVTNNAMPYKHDNNNNEQGMKAANNQNQATAKRDTSINNNQMNVRSDLIGKDPELVSDVLDDPTKLQTVKRSASGITNEKIDQLKSALNRMQNPGPTDKVEEIEDNLRDILSDMGLIEGEYNGADSYKNKRENDAKRDVDKEDENLEEGVNKIELVKATHEVPAVERNKREDKKEGTADKAKADNSPENLKKDQELKDSTSKYESTEIKEGEDTSELKSETNSKSELKKDRSPNEMKRSDAKINVANYQSEGEAYIRSKRQENNDIMKGLEKSGDLTVSGNKSPLASSESNAEMEKRRNKDQTSTAGTISEKTKREQDEFEYQKEIEQNIQTKIDAIKEQVKREIEALKTKERQRQKRDVNTLLEEETSALDPQKHPDEKLVPHVRRRRNLETLVRTKREFPDFSHLKSIDSGDYLDLAGEKQRDQRDALPEYHDDPQENKYFPDASLTDTNAISEKKRSSGDEQGLIAAETAPLNVNNQEDTLSQIDNTNIQERSVDSEVNLIKQSTSSTMVEKETGELLKERQGDKNLNTIVKNREQPYVVATPETNSNEESSVQKRSTDSPEENENAKDINVKDKEQIQDKKREISKPKVEEDKQSKRDVTISTKSIELSSSKSTDEPSVVQKNEPKRNTDNAALNLNPILQPEEQNIQEVINSRRMRRQIEQDELRNPSAAYSRRKRANAVMPYAKSSFFPYRAEEEGSDDEGEEFDENSFDDRSNLQKRDAGYGFQQNQFRPPLDYPQDYVASADYSSYQPEQKRSLASRYVANENADVYENPTNYLYRPATYVRQKRHNFDQLASLHGGGPMLHHLAAVRERNVQQLENDNNRNKRNFNKNGQSSNQNEKEEPDNIADLSASDLFGALPQSYDGSNLLRFKRIRREVDMNSENTQPTTQDSVKV